MISTADQMLAQQIRAGDALAWEQCIARYEGRLLAFVRSRLGDQATAEDVVQDTFVGFLTALPNLDPAQSMEAFLFSIAAHKLIDVLRRQGRRPTLPLLMQTNSGRDAEPAGPSRRASSLYRSREQQGVQARLLQTCLSDLIAGWTKTRDFERLKCAELLFVLGWSNKRVAEALNISEQAVANHKFFIVSKLKDVAAHSQSSPFQ